MTKLISRSSPSEIAFNALPHPILCLNSQGRIIEANVAAEAFFELSTAMMRRHRLADLLPSASPLLTLIDQVLHSSSPINEYRVDLGLPRLNADRLVDIQVAPLSDSGGGVIVVLQERTMVEKMHRQLSHRGAARSMTVLTSMLAHEIKNPLSGIRGAAQLLEQSLDDQDRSLTQLICDEADRIVRLIDRMEVFSDERPPAREAVNIHIVLEHVKKLAVSGFARNIRFVEDYDPSLPSTYANKDQLVQVMLNLVKNAAEVLAKTEGAEIQLTTGFKPGIKWAIPGSPAKVSLPLEICVCDNGPGVSGDIMPRLFEPFVTTKPKGSGLGLALVAKIVSDHGGVVECKSQPGKTIFRLLLPLFEGECA